MAFSPYLRKEICRRDFQTFPPPDIVIDLSLQPSIHTPTFKQLKDTYMLDVTYQTDFMIHLGLQFTVWKTPN